MTTDTQDAQIAINFDAPFIVDVADLDRANEFEAQHANGRTIHDAFVAFHASNPQVYQALRRLALAMRRRGVRQFGIAALFEVLRYEAALSTAGDEFKLNNSYRSFYARLLMEREGELAGFFETRSLGYITNIPAQGQA